MFRIAVCDDLAQEREKICLLLKEAFAARGAAAVFQEYESGGCLLSAWEKNELDVHLIFLDIYMEEPDGVETARLLRCRGCPSAIVFLTTSPDFAVEGYEVEAAGYLLKPPEQGKLQQLLERILRRENLMPIVLRQGNSVFSVVSSEIIYIESCRNRLLIHTVRETIPYYGRMTELVSRLSQKQFLRCHQSFLVNMDRIYSAEDDFLMENGDLVPIRVRERKTIREAYFQYMTERKG